MLTQGKIVQARALDMPKFSTSGWQVIPNRAFKNVAADIVAGMEPLPVMQRQDYKEYLRNNNIPFEFWSATF